MTGPPDFDRGPWRAVGFDGISTAFDGGALAQGLQEFCSDIEMVGAHVGAIPRDELRERGAPTSGQLKVIR